MKPSTEALIHELAADLPPVKPLGRLRDTIVAALGISLPFYLYWFITSGVRRQFRQGELPDGVYLMVASALLLVAAGGLLAGLAAAIPGREDASQLGRNLFLSGLAAGLSVLGYHWALGSTSVFEVSRSSAQCAMGAAMLAIPSALLVARFTARGAALHFPRALSLACAGGMGVSAGVIHLTCSHADPIHLVLGHALAPFAGGLVVLTGLSIAVGLASLLPRSDAS